MSRTSKALFWLLVASALLIGSVALAAGPADPRASDAECKFSNLECPNTWAPVSCKKGGFFENRCYAKRACAKACRNFFGG